MKENVPTEVESKAIPRSSGASLLGPCFAGEKWYPAMRARQSDHALRGIELMEMLKMSIKLNLHLISHLCNLR